MAMVQLLLGNIGVAGGGMNPVRGHSNIQGLTDLRLMSNLMPGYMNMPGDEKVSKAIYLKSRGYSRCDPDSPAIGRNIPNSSSAF